MKTLAFLSFILTLNSFADESFGEIAIQKKIQKNLSDFQTKIINTRPTLAFKASLIKSSLNKMETSVAQIERMDESQMPQGMTRADMISKIQKDTVMKVELMESLDPQSLKDMVMMDAQAMQTS